MSQPENYMSIVDQPSTPLQVSQWLMKQTDQTIPSKVEKTDLLYRIKEDGDKLRKDFGKERFDLLPPEALFALAELYTRGAEKYAARGWEEGMTWSRCFGSLMRHAWKWAKGEDYDPETGAHHMIAVAWNAFALYIYHVRKKGTDDRSQTVI